MTPRRGGVWRTSDRIFQRAGILSVDRGKPHLLAVIYLRSWTCAMISQAERDSLVQVNRVVYAEVDELKDQVRARPTIL